MHNDLNERRKAKKRLALNSRDIHVGWIVGAGVSMLIFLLATFATAYRHDASMIHLIKLECGSAEDPALPRLLAQEIFTLYMVR